MTDFLEGVTPQPYGGARDEMEELRANLALMTGWRDAAEARAESLRAKLEAAQADVERLEWLEQLFSPMGLSIDGNHAWVCRGNPADLRGPNMRAAIDAAIHKARGVKA